MILRPQLEPTDHQSVLNYYLENYSEVHIVTCSKCVADLAVEIRGVVEGAAETGYKVNELGFTVLPFGSNLLSSRVRTDGLMGYQCGNMVENPEFKPALEKYHKELEAHKAEVARLAAKHKRDYLKVAAQREKDGLEPMPMEAPPFVKPPENPMVDQFRRCMNDTRGNYIEEELSPTGSFLPHERAAIDERYRQVKYKPAKVVEGNIVHHESFKRERIK